MVSITDIVLSFIISTVYLVFIRFQLVVFPMKYYSVKDVIYSRNVKKATGALVTRSFFILIVCWLSKMLGLGKSVVIWGVMIGSFLCTWPSIYHYQLFCFWKNKYKLLYLLACVISVLFSWACANIMTGILLPMIYENKGFYLIDNNGIKTVFSIINFISPIGMRKVIKEEEQDNPYLVNDTFYADLYLTIRKIQFEKAFFDQYAYEIDETAEKYNISPSLLQTVIQLEKINRGSWLDRTIERLAVQWWPGLLIRRNATIGLAQINIQAAQGFFHRAPQRYIRDMLKPEISIELCAYILRILLREYEEYNPSDVDDPFIDIYDSNDFTEDYKRSLFIASNYICGENIVLKKYILVYAQLIYDAIKE